MSDERAHSVAIGGFIIGALLIALATLLFVLGSGLGSDRTRVVMVFDSSVKGLSVGAPVTLRGVEIGQVTGINLLLDSNTAKLIMQVEADLSGESIQMTEQPSVALIDDLIGRGLRAQLNLQSLLTGLLYVQLDFHPETPVALPAIDTEYTQIPTIPTELERIVSQIEGLDIAQMAADLQSIATNVNAFVQQAPFQQLPADIGQTLASLRSLTAQVESTLSTAGPGIDRVLDNSNTLVSEAKNALPRLTSLLEDNMNVLRSATERFEGTMGEIDGLVSADSATTYRLNEALRELALAGRALQMLAKTLEEQPESLLRGKSENSQ
ncbi:MAG TPA: MCE family protein [Halieaceae bacterium]|uniref:MlaD family protein n=1 Tax=Haliea salexigens TaxID=287487 RepID=UPI00040748AA|nr:MlaD family protein [Haliea salexigens]HBX72862.1 MCE family protein [Halieaceae bacterium]